MRRARRFAALHVRRRASRRAVKAASDPSIVLPPRLLSPTAETMEHLMNRLLAQNRLSVWLYVAGGVAAVGAGGALLWRARGKAKTSEEIASVAGKALDDVKLQRQAQAVAKGVVKHVLDDAATLTAVQRLVYAFLHLPATDDALAALIDRVLRRDDVGVWLQVLVRGQVELLLQDEATKAQLVRLVGDLTRDAQTQRDVGNLIKESLRTPQLERAAVVLVNTVVDDRAFNRHVNKLGERLAEHVLASEAVQTAAHVCITEILDDEAVHAAVADTAWAGVKKAVWL